MVFTVGYKILCWDAGMKYVLFIAAAILAGAFYFFATLSSYAAFWTGADGSISCERVCQKKNALAVPVTMGDSGIFQAKYICSAVGFISSDVGTVISSAQNPKFNCRVFYEVSIGGVRANRKVVKSNFQCLCD